MSRSLREFVYFCKDRNFKFKPPQATAVEDFFYTMQKAGSGFSTLIRMLHAYDNRNVKVTNSVVQSKNAELLCVDDMGKPMNPGQVIYMKKMFSAKEIDKLIGQTKFVTELKSNDTLKELTMSERTFSYSKEEEENIARQYEATPRIELEEEIEVNIALLRQRVRALKSSSEIIPKFDEIVGPEMGNLVHKTYTHRVTPADITEINKKNEALYKAVHLALGEVQSLLFKTDRILIKSYRANKEYLSRDFTHTEED